MTKKQSNISQPIAIYGLSVETEKAIPVLEKEYHILGLLDGFRTEGELYGCPIISLEEAIQAGVKLIIVVARPGSCKAIAKKIGATCLEHGIALFDIRGNDLLEPKKVTYDFCGLSAIYRSELLEKIAQADVVSFDLFDTLVMRKTLNAEDVIRLVECKLRERGVEIKNFCQERLRSEKELSRSCAPKLSEIYEDVLSRIEAADATEALTAGKLAALEWETDVSLLIARKTVCEILEQAVALGKKVYIVSDSYYSKEQLGEILKKCSVACNVKILSSSDYGTGKTQGLFDVLLEKESGKRILHIGDDLIADVESAGRRGISAYRLYSGKELFEAVGCFGIPDDMDSVADCLKIGMFVEKIFNNPFQFESEDLRISVSDAYDIGYLFCAPVISDFVHWFEIIVREQHLENIWFCARDGFLIQRLYRRWVERKGGMDDSLYFLTSRTAAIRAGMESDEDISYVNEMKFSGSLEESLKKRFGMDAEQIPAKMILEEEEGLLRYKNAIFAKSKERRNNYKKYIAQCKVRDGNIAFFDFVAKGTCQRYVQKLVENHLVGLYFLQLEAAYMKKYEVDIFSFYHSEETESSVIFENYYILETLLTAPHPSISDFTEDGKAVYAEETRTEKDIQCFMRAQAGIEEYFHTFAELCPFTEWVENKKLDEILLGVISHIVICDEDFLGLTVEDPFFNRMTEITTVL